MRLFIDELLLIVEDLFIVELLDVAELMLLLTVPEVPWLFIDLEVLVLLVLLLL